MDASETQHDIGILPERLYPVYAAARRLHVSRSTMKRAMHDGLPHVRWRGDPFIRGEKLISWILDHGEPSSGKAD